MRNLSRTMESGTRSLSLSISYLLVNYRKLYRCYREYAKTSRSNERKLDLIPLDSVQVAEPPLPAFGKYLKHINNIRLLSSGVHFLSRLFTARPEKFNSLVNNVIRQKRRNETLAETLSSTVDIPSSTILLLSSLVAIFCHALRTNCPEQDGSVT